MTMINCPVCESTQTKPFLLRNHVPVHQNIVFDHQEHAVDMVRGELSLFLCNQCGFVFNASFDDTKLNYSSMYNNIQEYSSTFHQYTDELVDRILNNLPHASSTIVEVGCGKGHFLNKLFTRNQAIKGYGFDPSYEGDEILHEGRLVFMKDFYGPSYEHIQADVVICRHVIEHIQQPVELLATIREALRNSPNARVYFETPCVEWIFRNTVVWDFFYEHCSYFSIPSLTMTFERAGYQVERYQHVFQGQYLWFEAVVDHTGPKGQRFIDPASVLALADQYLIRENMMKERWATALEHALTEGDVAVWGAGAKGVTFANLFDPLNKKITCYVDLNPSKQGRFLPGSGHPILHYHSLRSEKIRYVFLMNPNYREEVEALIKEHQLCPTLVDLGKE
ncbi:hypothetical protein BVG16_05465 [Paenibacillus selenitireducens]|uniref:C-methyltransferase domain-containing protein n=1 Tax=Paenibacillus selenitireducens TaxID=1324314 RepID=A0A1T2XKH6_9BACL|nr:class I SAM-dependent methyltransferase [Paenibacillus selenitireducens]OPA80193.1 hypothetical protein BVG16_05465 [Paenibacillus selenitireducens]